MRQLMVTVSVAVACVLVVAGCDDATVNAETATTETMIPRPLVARELAAVLLGAKQVNAAMGATAMA